MSNTLKTIAITTTFLAQTASADWHDNAPCNLVQSFFISIDRNDVSSKNIEKVLNVIVGNLNLRLRQYGFHLSFKNIDVADQGGVDFKSEKTQVLYLNKIGEDDHEAVVLGEIDPEGISGDLLKGTQELHTEIVELVKKYVPKKSE